jgi:DNA polymerase III alpha subunit
MLFEICEQKLKEKNLDGDKKYQKRLKWELEEIKVKDKESYFLDLYNRKVQYPSNQNNLLVCWLLGICKDHKIEDDPHCEYGEYPDIDTDYIPVVRAYLKEVWAAQKFGAEYVCNIANYTTFGIKSSLIDMARVHGESREEIQALTKNLDSKDDEGKSLTWDMAMKLYPDLKKYCETHPEIADSAKRLINRNRGSGIHAGGLIIASRPLHDLVPLIKRKDSPQASAWVEGLHGKDLQPVGLIKFDLLVISNLLQIARCCEMVKKRHKLDGICAKPGLPDWSDIEAWRNDPVALKMANSGGLKCIFQFDKETVRAMARSGGVDRFEDLVAYTSLNRPGPLGMKMQERYIERKRNRETYSLHKLVKPILEKNYGVLVYQEDIIKILHVVGEVPLKDCELVRKAISAKKVEGFIKYKEMFLTNGKKNLNVSDEEITHLWNQIEAFAEYGFNKSHAVAYTYISAWLLYLKAHFPHEFFASILSCETLSEKIKEYKMEAKIHKVDVHRLDINKSGVNFELQGEVVYYGMSNIKGIGEAPAKRIVAGQPYKSFEDFLCRFGTDASVLKPLLGLRCFRDRDPITLWKFSEHFKNCFKKIEDKKKRYAASLVRYEDEFKALVPNETRKLADFDEDPFDSEEWKIYDKDEVKLTSKKVQCEETDEGAFALHVVTAIPVDDPDLLIDREKIKYFKISKVKKSWNRWKALKDLWIKRKRTIDRYANMVEGSLPTLAGFDPNSWDIPDELAKEFMNPVACEEKYYGFAWIHELEKSPDYLGNLTFDALKNDIDVVAGAVEMKIIKSSKITSKKGHTYYQLVAEDVTGQQNKINVWQDDWDWWEPVLNVKNKEPGNLVRLRLQPPSGGFSTFTLEPNQVGFRRGIKRYNHKDDDIRVILYEKGKKEEEKFLTDDEALAQFTNCTME